jgi:hypothetical protein
MFSFLRAQKYFEWRLQSPLLHYCVSFHLIGLHAVSAMGSFIQYLHMYIEDRSMLSNVFCSNAYEFSERWENLIDHFRSKQQFSLAPLSDMHRSYKRTLYFSIILHFWAHLKFSFLSFSYAALNADRTHFYKYHFYSTFQYNWNQMLSVLAEVSLVTMKGGRIRSTLDSYYRTVAFCVWYRFLMIGQLLQDCCLLCGTDFLWLDSCYRNVAFCVVQISYDWTATTRLLPFVWYRFLMIGQLLQECCLFVVRISYDGTAATGLLPLVCGTHFLWFVSFLLR